MFVCIDWHSGDVIVQGFKGNDDYALLSIETYEDLCCAGYWDEV